MEKIKINLDKATLNKLYQDMMAFQFVKSDSQLNKNKFLNILIKNYFPIYDELANKEIEKCSKIVNKHISNSKHANEIINDLIKADNLFAFNKSETLNAFISFKPNNQNKNIINIIYQRYLKFQTLSSFFRNLIIHYLSLPQYKREQIIFLDNYQLITESIKNNRKLSISIKGVIKNIIPYKIVTNKEEIYNYLICYTLTNNSINIASYHLYKIDYVYLCSEKASANNSQIEILEKVATTYPQFPISKNEDSKIQLSENGIKLFSSKYLNRPEPYKIENDIYYFDCSYTQILVYFFSFGKDAKILEPVELKELFKKEYLLAFNTYNE